MLRINFFEMFQLSRQRRKGQNLKNNFSFPVLQQANSSRECPPTVRRMGAPGDEDLWTARLRADVLKVERQYIVSGEKRGS